MKLRMIGIALCAGVLAGCSTKKTAPPPEPMAAPRAATAPAALPSGSIGEETRTATATVQSVDLKTRHVTLKDSEGKKAGQAKPGVAASSDVTRAPLGEKPSGSVTDTVTVRMTIAEIDKAAPTVTLRDPDGSLSVVKVKDPKKLDLVQVGDVVDITYTEALAIAVEAAGRK